MDAEPERVPRWRAERAASSQEAGRRSDGSGRFFSPLDREWRPGHGRASVLAQTSRAALPWLDDGDGAIGLMGHPRRQPVASAQPADYSSPALSISISASSWTVAIRGERAATDASQLGECTEFRL